MLVSSCFPNGDHNVLSLHSRNQQCDALMLSCSDFDLDVCILLSGNVIQLLQLFYQRTSKIDDRLALTGFVTDNNKACRLVLWVSCGIVYFANRCWQAWWIDAGLLSNQLKRLNFHPMFWFCNDDSFWPPRLYCFRFAPYNIPSQLAQSRGYSRLHLVLDWNTFWVL